MEILREIINFVQTPTGIFVAILAVILLGSLRKFNRQLQVENSVPVIKNPNGASNAPIIGSSHSHLLNSHASNAANRINTATARTNRTINQTTYKSNSQFIGVFITILVVVFMAKVAFTTFMSFMDTLQQSSTSQTTTTPQSTGYSYNGQELVVADYLTGEPKSEQLSDYGFATLTDGSKIKSISMQLVDNQTDNDIFYIDDQFMVYADEYDAIHDAYLYGQLYKAIYIDDEFQDEASADVDPDIILKGYNPSNLNSYYTYPAQILNKTFEFRLTSEDELYIESYTIGYFNDDVTVIDEINSDTNLYKGWRLDVEAAEHLHSIVSE